MWTMLQMIQHLLILPMLRLVVISIDAYPFLAFSDLTCHLKDTGIGVFLLDCAILIVYSL